MPVNNVSLISHSRRALPSWRSLEVGKLCWFDDNAHLVSYTPAVGICLVKLSTGAISTTDCLVEPALVDTEIKIVVG